MEAIRQGKWRPALEEQVPIELSPERPNIFRLYEDHIGPLTPMLAETLTEAQELYPGRMGRRCIPHSSRIQ
jgi:DNA replication protein